MSQFLNHLEVVGYTLAQSLGLEQFTFVAEKLALSAEIDSNLVDGACRVLFRRHEDIGRIYVESVKLRQNGSRFRIHRADTFNFITPENNTQLNIFEGEEYIDCIPLYAELTALEFDFRAAVERVHELAEESVA